MALGARYSDAALIQLRYLVAHLVVLPSAGLFVFSCLFTVQALLSVCARARLLRALSVGLQVVCVVGVLQMIVFSRNLMVWTADNALRLSGDSVAAWLPPFWFLGLYETVLGTEHAVFRELAPRAVLATAASLAVTVVLYLAAYTRITRRVLESPASLAREPDAVARAVRWVTRRVLVRGATEQAVVGFVAKTMCRSQRYPLILAVYVGIALAFVVTAVLFSWPGTVAGSGMVASVMRVIMGARGDAPGLGAPTVALLSIPHVLSFFTIVGLRILFTIPSELPAHWVFRLTEVDDKAGYLRAARHALRLSLVPIVAVTLPWYWWLWGAGPAFGHTVLWLLLAAMLAELALFGFHKVPFTCAHVPGRANVKLFGYVYLMAFGVYAFGTSGAELWLLAGSAQWGAACAVMTVCLALAVGVNDRARQTTRPLRFEEQAEPVLQGLHLAGPGPDRPLREEDLTWGEREAGDLFIGIESVKEAGREAGGLHAIAIPWVARCARDLRQDVVYGLRRIVKAPGFATVGIISLAIGIGLCSVSFAALSAQLVRPLPGAADPTGLVSLQQPVPYPFFETYRDEGNFAVAAAVFVGPVPFGVTTADETTRVFGHLVSPEYFTTLGVVPQAGRLFAPATERPGSDSVVVVSDLFWQTRLDADPGAVGRSLRLNGQLVTIVGIGPEDFLGVCPASPADLFVPITGGRAVAPQLGDDPVNDGNLDRFRVLFRLADGVRRPAAETALDVMTRALEADDPDPERAREGRQTTLLSAENLVPISDQLWWLLVGPSTVLLGLILTLVCGNLGTLLLARAAERRREVAIRLSLGASRGRLVRQLLTESVVMALGGGGLGIVFAYGMIRSGAPLGPPGGALALVDVGVDLPVLAFTVVVSVLAGVGFGLMPAIATSRAAIAGMLKGGDLAPWRRYPRYGVRNLLVVYQVAAAFALLLYSGVSVLGFQRLATIAPGFDTAPLTLLDIDPPRDGLSPATAARLLDRIEERLTQLPDVEAVTLTFTPPFASLQVPPNFRVSVPIPGRDTTAQHTILRHTVGTSYFSTLGIPVVRGRDLETRDRRSGDAAERGAGAIPVVLNRAAAARLFPGGDALGQPIRAIGRGTGRDETLFSVVGVAEDVKSDFMNANAVPTTFSSMTEASFVRGVPSGTTLVLRAALGPDAVSAVRTDLGLLFDLTLFNVRTMDEQISQLNALILPFSIMSGGFMVFGLILAGIGLAAVITHTVHRRRKEIGIRTALGARARQVLQLVLTEYVALVVVGGVLGCAAGVALVRGASATFEGFARVLSAGAGAPVVLVGAPALLVAVALIACYLPARRSTRIDPLLALREE